MRLGKRILEVLIMAVVFVACKSDDGTPEIDLTQQRIDLLAKTWVLSGEVNAVSKDDEDVTTDYTGFTLTATQSKDYSTTAGDPTWKSSGKWDFAGTADTPDLNKLNRDDGVVIDIMNVTETSLVLRFEFVTAQAGSVNSLDGTYTFNLVVQQ